MLIVAARILYSKAGNIETPQGSPVVRTVGSWLIIFLNLNATIEQPYNVSFLF